MIVGAGAGLLGEALRQDDVRRSLWLTRVGGAHRHRDRLRRRRAARLPAGAPRLPRQARRRGHHRPADRLPAHGRRHRPAHGVRPRGRHGAAARAARHQLHRDGRRHRRWPCCSSACRSSSTPRARPSRWWTSATSTWRARWARRRGGAFLRVTFPQAWRGVLAGAVLMWGRGISEFGAVVILAYNPKVISVLTFERFEGFGLRAAQPPAVLIVHRRVRRLPRRCAPCCCRGAAARGQGAS